MPRDGARGKARLGRVANLALGGCIVLAIGYTFHRAVVLRTEYFDGYDYLTNARALLRDPVAGFGFGRPPLVSLLHLPATAIGRASDPGSALRLIAPHLSAALLSALTAGTVFWVFRRAFDPTFALLGTLFFVGTGYFVHYGAHAMADLPSAGFTAAAVTLYPSPRSARPRWVRWVACGLAVGCAVLTKFPLATLAAALGVTELAYAVRRRRIEWRRWLGVAAVGATAILVVVAVYAGVLVRLRLPMRAGSSEIIANLRPGSLATGFLGMESWRDYGPILPTLMSWSTLMLAVLGLGIALLRWEDRDVPFLAWLVVVGGAVVFLIAHTEARYLLPAIPAVLYFSVRGAEALVGIARARWRRLPRVGRALCLVVGAATLVASMHAGVRQAVLDQDPCYRSDVQLEAARMLLSARRLGGRILLIRNWHVLHPRHRFFVPYDEFFAVYHFGPRAVAYLTDVDARHLSRDIRDPDPAALALAARDGDVLLRGPEAFYYAWSLPPDDVPPMEVWAIRKALLQRFGQTYVAHQPTDLRLIVSAGTLMSARTPEEEPWQIFAPDGPDGSLRLLGESSLRRGETLAFGEGETDSLVALHVDRRTVD